MKDSNIKVRFDSDGVLADMRGYMDKHNIPYNHGNARDRNVDKKMWGIIRCIPHFYRRLAPIPGSIELFNQLNEKYDCSVLTAIPKESWGIKDSAEDKIGWCKHFLGEDVEVNICYRAEKQNFVKSRNDVLIDDLPRNIQEWEAQGGTGILFTGAENFDFNKLKNLENTNYNKIVDLIGKEKGDQTNDVGCEIR